LLVFLLLFFQAQLWIGDGSISQQQQLKRDIKAQRESNDALRARNDDISLEIRSLGDQVDNDEGLEERARSELGMIEDGEVFYMMVDDKRVVTDDTVKEEMIKGDKTKDDSIGIENIAQPASEDLTPHTAPKPDSQ